MWEDAVRIRKTALLAGRLCRITQRGPLPLPLPVLRGLSAPKSGMPSKGGFYSLMHGPCPRSQAEAGSPLRRLWPRRIPQHGADWREKVQSHQLLLGVGPLEGDRCVLYCSLTPSVHISRRLICELPSSRLLPPICSGPASPACASCCSASLVVSGTVGLASKVVVLCADGKWPKSSAAPFSSGQRRIWSLPHRYHWGLIRSLLCSLSPPSSLFLNTSNSDSCEQAPSTRRTDCVSPIQLHHPLESPPASPTR